MLHAMPHPTRTDNRRSAAGRPNACLLYLTIRDISPGGVGQGGGQLDKLVRRRQVRIERVLGVQGGNLLRRTPGSLLAAFPTPEAAVVAACGMQRLCAAIPQIADAHIVVKIGIHAAEGAVTTPYGIEAAELLAIELAALSEAGGVVVTGELAETLPALLQDCAEPIDGAGHAAHAIDWRAVPVNDPPPPDSSDMDEAAPDESGQMLILRHGTQSFRFSSAQTSITIGRDPTNDILVADRQASRRHCRIFYRMGSYVLVDVSLNGTFVRNGDGSEQPVRKGMLVLSGNGQIGFGKAVNEHSFAFEVVGG